MNMCVCVCVSHFLPAVHPGSDGGHQHAAQQDLSWVVDPQRHRHQSEVRISFDPNQPGSRHATQSPCITHTHTHTPHTHTPHTTHGPTTQSHPHTCFHTQTPDTPRR